MSPRTRRLLRVAHVLGWAAAIVATFVLVRGVSGPHRPHRHSPPARRRASLPPVGRVVATIPTTGPSGDIASGAGSIWVGTDGGESLTRIDPVTDRVVAGPILTGDFAMSALAASSGGALVGDGMRWLDATTNRIGPRVLAGECDQPSAAGDASGFVWYLDTGSDPGCGKIAELDSTTGRVVHTWPLPDGSSDMQILTGDGQVWIADATSSPPMLDRLDARTGRRQPIARLGSGDTVAVGDGVIGLLDWADRPPTLTRLDERTRRKLGTTPLIEINAEVSVSLAEGGRRFWLVINGRRTKLVAYDARTGKPAGAPLVLADDGAPLYAFGALWWTGNKRVLKIAPR